ncbi:MAG: IclR family transcriptional regulator [Pseudomonadota bacterium]
MHLDRLIMILETLAIAGRPVSAMDVQRATGLPKPTCYRHLQALLKHRLIASPGDDGAYVVGERLLGIAMLGMSDADVREVATPLLKTAVVQFNEPVFLARLRHQMVEIIHIDTPDDPNRAFIYPGLGERPLHACSCSKAIAAFADPEFRDNLMRGAHKRYTPFTKTTAPELRAELDRIRERGFAECNEEIDMGVASVAAPIAIGGAGATFSVGAVGPIRRFTSSYRSSVGQALIELARRLGETFQLSRLVTT